MGDRARVVVVSLGVLVAARRATAQPVTTTSDRTGLSLYGGIGLDSDVHWPRLDVLYPIPLANAPRLRIGMVLTYYHAKAAIPEYAIEAYGLGLYPTATYDWVLPVRSAVGTFVMGIDSSLGPAIGRVKIDEPFMPGNFETTWALVFRAAGRAEFRANQGWLVAAQLLGFDVPVTEANQVSKGVVTTTDIGIEFALLGGWQFR